MDTKTYFEINLKPKNRNAFYENGGIYIQGRGAYEVKNGIDWLADPFEYRSWRWILNNFKWMDGLLYEYVHKGKKDAILLCVDFLISWYDFYILKKNVGEFLWKDDAVSLRSFRLAVIANYILNNDSECSENVKDLAKHAVKMHYEELTNEKRFKKNNHGLFQVRGLMTLSTLLSDFVDLEKAKEYSKEKIDFLWPQQYGEQCFHLENSTGYHQFALKEFSEILESPEFSGMDLVYNRSHLDRALDNTKYLFHPNGIATLFGDTKLIKKDLPIFSGDRIFNEAGYAFLAGSDKSKDNSYLALRTGFRSNIHRHSDDFTFEWSEYGEVIIQDSGRYAYDYNHPYRKFVTSTRAHNTITVNGKNFPWHKDFKEKDFYRGAVDHYESFANNSKITLKKEFFEDSVVYNRLIEFKKGSSLRVIDSLRSKEENTYEQWFHLAESFELEERSIDMLRFSSSNLRLVVQVPRGVEILLCRGQKEPFLQGWISYGEQQLVPRWSFGFLKKQAKCAVFETSVKVEKLT